MTILGKTIIDEYKKDHADVRPHIDSWEAEVKEAQWNMPVDIKEKYKSASILGSYNVIFNLKGNKYRMWVKVNYKNKIVLIKKIGTHREYMKWKII